MLLISLGIVVLIIILIKVTVSLKFKSLYPLLPKKHNFGKRRNTFRKALKLMQLHNASVLVETGVARQGLNYSKSDGASTIVFGTWAKNNGAKLFSVDINPKAISTCQSTINELGLSEHIKLNISDSINYLENFEGNIDFLYLDSYDYNRNNPSIIKASQVHHLNEIMAAENKFHDNTIILIDDCKLPGGGKGKDAVRYLMEKGWKMNMNKYQILLTK